MLRADPEYLELFMGVSTKYGNECRVKLRTERG